MTLPKRHATVLTLIFCLTQLPAFPALGQPTASGRAESGSRLPSIRSENGRLVLDGMRPPTGRRRQVLAWHDHWLSQIAKVEKAELLLLHVLRDEHPSMLPSACRLFGEALLEVDRDSLWPAPDYALHRHLWTQMDHLIRAAAACLAGRRAAVGAELRRARRARDQAELALRRWVE